MAAIFLSRDGVASWRASTGSEDPLWAPPLILDLNRKLYFDLVGVCWGRPVYRERVPLVGDTASENWLRENGWRGNQTQGTGQFFWDHPKAALVMYSTPEAVTQQKAWDSE